MTMPFSKRGAALGVLLLAGAAAAQNEGPAEFSLLNKAKDIRVISDRDETILAYFRRSRALVAGVLPEGLNKILEAKAPLTRFFVSYASQNDDPARASTFGAYLEIAPPSAAVAKLLSRHKDPLTRSLVLRRDDRKPGLYHVVGCTERTSVGFFDNDKRNAADGFSQKDLCYRGGAKK
jgi:hypothetical protein